MQTFTDIHAINSRMMEIIDELDGTIDPAFDNVTEDLEREFAELRLQLSNHE